MTLTSTTTNHITTIILAYLFTTEDHKEGATSFIEKREPNFKGR